MKAFEAIDQQACVDVNSIGLSSALLRATSSKLGDSPSYLASKRLLDVMNRGEVLLVTGYPIPYPFSSKREVHSDGPVGIASLARALLSGFGVKSTVLVDEGLGKMQHALLESCGIARSSIEVEEFLRDANPSTQASEILDRLNPSAVIASEKSAMNSDAVFHTALGNNLSPYVLKTDFIFKEAQRRGILTVGIGDVGNEIGMGLIREALPKILPNSGRCKCGCEGGIISNTETDLLLIGSMSDWGVYSLIAGVALSSRKPELVPTGDEVRNVMRVFAKEADLRDETELMTDGIPVECTIGALEIFRNIVKSALR